MNSNGIDFERYDTNLGIEYSSYASEKLGRDLWVVKRSFNYWLDGGQIRRISVPAGYLTDGASVRLGYSGELYLPGVNTDRLQ